jgi:hypothetical protein
VNAATKLRFEKEPSTAFELTDGQTKEFLSSDGKWLAEASNDAITMHGVAAAKRLWSIKASDKVMAGFTPNGKHLVVVDNDNVITLHVPESGKEFRSILPRDKFDIVEGVLVSKDRMSIPECRQRVYLDEAHRGQVPPPYQSNQPHIASCNNRLIAKSEGEIVSLIETRTGLKIASFQTALKGNISCVLFDADGRQLITGSENSSIHVWDWAQAAKLKPDAQALPDASTWQGLSADDPAKAYRAIFTYVAHPREAVAVLREQLKPATKRERDQVRDWIESLDHPKFAVRDQAKRALTLQGEDALGELHATMNRKLTPEVEQSVKQLLAANPEGLSREGTRQVRAIQALEWMNTTESRELLRELANGESYALRTREAGRALNR